MAISLYDLIILSSNGDKDSKMILINKFQPLLTKYSKKLNYEGAETDLVIFFLELISVLSKYNKSIFKNNERVLVKYIATSICHKYINLSKKNRNLHNHEIIVDTIETHVSKSLNRNEEYNLLLYELIDKLLPLQKSVLIEIFVKGKSCSDIANELAVSRQTINKIKNKALNNLKIGIQSDN